VYTCIYQACAGLTRLTWQPLRPFCALSASNPCPLRHAHHSRFAQCKGLGVKVSDEFTVPLWAIHHQNRATGTERLWWREHKIDPLAVATHLWRKTPAIASAAGQIILRPRLGEDDFRVKGLGLKPRWDAFARDDTVSPRKAKLGLPALSRPCLRQLQADTLNVQRILMLFGEQMIRSFRDKRTRLFGEGQRIPQFHVFRHQAERRLRILEAATSLQDLASLSSNHLEALGGDRIGSRRSPRLGSTASVSTGNGAFVLSGQSTPTAPKTWK
jgi:hypothetical protein